MRAQAMRHKALDKQGVAYDVVDITENSEARDYVMALGYLQAPSGVAGDELGRGSVRTASHWGGRRGRHRPIRGSRTTGEKVRWPVVCYSACRRNPPIVEAGSSRHPNSQATDASRWTSPYVLILPTPRRRQGHPGHQQRWLCAQAIHRISQQRAQPVVDPRRHRRGQQQFSAKSSSARATWCPQVRRAVSLPLRTHGGPPDDVKAVRTGLKISGRN